MFTTLQAWNGDATNTAVVEVPYDRSAGCAVVSDRPLDSGVTAELARAGRLILETPGGISASTASGWTVSR